MKTPTLAALLALAALPASADGPYAHLTGVLTNINGSVENFDENGQTSIDFDSNLGFDEELAYEARGGFVFFGRNRLGGGIARFKHDVSESIRGFEFEGQQYDAEASLTNDLRWLEAEYGLALIKNDLAKFELFLGGRLYQYEGEAAGRARPSGGGVGIERVEKAEVTAPVPHVGAMLELRVIPMLVLRGTGKGFFIGVGTGEGGEIDLEATAGIRLGALEIGGGYRYFDVFVSADDDQLQIDLGYQGPTAYVRFSM